MRNMKKLGENVLIFGASGMLGKEIYREAKSLGYKVTGASRRGPDAEIDLLDVEKVQDLIFKLRPDLIINSAALVSHALCEEKPEIAYAVNAKAVGIMANAARQLNKRFVHISTDHFYTGDCDKLHDETAPVILLNEYARTKYAGEAFALTYSDALVIRTNITGIRGGGGITSFFEWVIGVLESHEEFNLFEDYFTSTISTQQAAAILFELLDHQITGICNLACREAVSKKQFVETVASKLGADLSHARTRSVHELLSPRAESVGLDVSRAEKLLDKKLPTLNEVVDHLLMEYSDDQISSKATPMRLQANR